VVAQIEQTGMRAGLPKLAPSKGMFRVTKKVLKEHKISTEKTLWAGMGTSCGCQFNLYYEEAIKYRLTGKFPEHEIIFWMKKKRNWRATIMADNIQLGTDTGGVVVRMIAIANCSNILFVK
jgi:hypothetical protein